MAIEDVVCGADGRVVAYRMSNGAMRERSLDSPPTYEELRASLDELVKAVEASQRVSSWATFFRGSSLKDAASRAKALLTRVRPRGLAG